MTVDFEELAATSPGEFLYEVYRESPFVNLEVHLVGLADKNRLCKTWALYPAQDGLRALFGAASSSESQSLRRALKDFKKAAIGRWVKEVDEQTPDGRTMKLNAVDLDALTPASLIETMTQAVRLEKALAARKVASALDRGVMSDPAKTASCHY